MQQSPVVVNLDFTKIEVYEHLVISTIDEGIVFDKPELEELYNMFNTFFPKKIFGYLSNRINDYSINPTCYIKSGELPNLVAFASVCYAESTFRMAQFEKKFYTRPYEIFRDFDAAKEYIEEQVDIKNAGR